MKTCSSFFCLFFSFIINAQDVKTAIIKVDTSANTEAFAIPYSSIKVIDARFDRTKIGCCYNSVFLNSIITEKYEARFPDSFTTYFPKFLTTFIKLEPSSKDQLIILTKQFRIADHILKGIEADPVEMELTLKFSASFFALHESKCYKLFSVDNIFIHNIGKLHERKRKFEEGSRSFALRVMLDKLLQSQNWQANTSQSSFTLPDIESAIQKRFDLPIYNVSTKKGIYKTFSDFKNNSPASDDFIVVYKDGKIDHLEDEKGKPYETEGLWGLCDGIKNYIRVRDEFSEVLTNDKNFRVLNYATFSELAGSSGGYDLLSGTFGKLKNGMKVWQYFDIDMETGRLYLQEIFGKSSFSFQ